MCSPLSEEFRMKYNKKVYILSKAASVLTALALCLSLVFPAASVDAYAVTGGNTDTGRSSNAYAAAGSTANTADTGEQAALYQNDTSAALVTAVTPAETVISNYKTSENKRNNEVLNIDADITPANGREVQLQRFNSTENIWDTIETISCGDSITGDSTGDSAGDASHVCFTVPQEERLKTTSVWRLFVPATETASEAYSDNINVITRNIEKLSLSARTACVYRIDQDGSGTMIYSKNSYKEVAQASTTKLMTAILLLESGKIDSTTKISAHAASTPWGSGRLAAGDVYNTRDLMYAMLLPSSNDAATAIAEKVGGSEAGFVKKMNAKAESLGFVRTHFRNPHGLDADGHYTTALELAKLTAYAYTFPEIRDCWATRCKTIKSLKKGRRWTLWSSNAIFSYVSNFLGGKTGTEENAGCCFTGVYTYEGSTYVTVVLGSGYGFARWSDTKKLHKYIQNYAASVY